MLNEEVIEKYKKAGRIAAKARDLGASMIKKGVSFLEIANAVEEYIISQGALPAFPANITVDTEAAHFTPRHDDERVIERGQVVKLDVGAHIDGYIGDTAITIEVATHNWRDLIRASSEALSIAIEMMYPGTRLEDIGRAIEECIKSYGFKPIENLTGHSMEKYKLHAGISVPNVGDKMGTKIKSGDVLAVEPFATDGFGRVAGKKNGNIYKFIKKKFIYSLDAKKLLSVIEDKYKLLPFAERWCVRCVDNIKHSLRTLQRHGVITYYPILSEIDDGMVSQKEHTVIVTDGMPIVTTSL